MFSSKIKAFLKQCPLTRGVCRLGYRVLSKTKHRLFEKDISLHPEAKIITLNEPHTHFFGYYDKSPWSSDLSRLLYHRYVGGKQIEMIVYNLSEECPNVLGSSMAWNWQQGSMLQWWPDAPDVVVYNVLIDGALRAVLHDAQSSEIVAQLPMPIQTVRRDGKAAISLNYRRLARLRPDYGYFVEASNFEPEQPEKEDGLWRVDVDGESTELVLSIDDLRRYAPHPSMDGAEHKVNHAMYAPLGNRLVFMHRWITPQGKRDRLYTVNDDGSELCLLADDGMCSHYSWIDSSRLLAYCRKRPWGDGYFFFEDREARSEPLGADGLMLRGDGHPSFSPDGRWIVTDTYPGKTNMRDVLLHDPKSATTSVVGRFFQPWKFGVTDRCDPHPRWSHDSRCISIDSAHTGQRRMYILDVSRLVSKPKILTNTRCETEDGNTLS